MDIAELEMSQGEHFDSRQRISDFLPASSYTTKKPHGVGMQWDLGAKGDSGIDACSINTHTRGNDSAQTA